MLLIVMDNVVYHKLTSFFLLFLAEPRPRNNYYFSSTIITQLISYFIKYSYYYVWVNFFTEIPFLVQSSHTNIPLQSTPWWSRCHMAI